MMASTFFMLGIGTQDTFPACFRPAKTPGARGEVTPFGERQLLLGLHPGPEAVDLPIELNQLVAAARVLGEGGEIGPLLFEARAVALLEISIVAQHRLELGLDAIRIDLGRGLRLALRGGRPRAALPARPIPARRRAPGAALPRRVPGRP